MLKTKKTVSVEKKVYEMLTENTGRHFLDSGGAYGRHWEENQKKTLEDFKDEDKFNMEVYKDEVLFSIPVFHYLTAFLKLDNRTRKLNEEFEEYMQQSDDGYLTNIKKFGKKKGYKVTTINTYNEESILSQTLQFTLYMQEDEVYTTEFVAVQIHNGCDVRGGYTKPVIFTFQDFAFEYFMSEYRKVYAFVEINGDRIQGMNECAGYEDSWLEIDPDQFIYLPEKNEVHYIEEGNKINFYPGLEY